MKSESTSGTRRPDTSTLIATTNLTAYDAAYIVLANHLRTSLVTFDKVLGLAAREVL